MKERKEILEKEGFSEKDLTIMTEFFTLLHEIDVEGRAESAPQKTSKKSLIKSKKAVVLSLK
jgi:hypothetical protein